ncbi:MAG: hypothetical protein P8M16_08165 [Acidimicrobiales bacterium]|nr:hypothetical protein [Acidimicrobiales bacterium]
MESGSGFGWVVVVGTSVVKGDAGIAVVAAGATVVDVGREPVSAAVVVGGAVTGSSCMAGVAVVVAGATVVDVDRKLVSAAVVVGGAATGLSTTVPIVDLGPSVVSDAVVPPPPPQAETSTTKAKSATNLLIHPVWYRFRVPGQRSFEV